MDACCNGLFLFAVHPPLMTSYVYALPTLIHNYSSLIHVYTHTHTQDAEFNELQKFVLMCIPFVFCIVTHIFIHSKLPGLIFRHSRYKHCMGPGRHALSLSRLCMYSLGSR